LAVPGFAVILVYTLQIDWQSHGEMRISKAPELAKIGHLNNADIKEEGLQ
jgi:hypothetical protein